MSKKDLFEIGATQSSSQFDAHNAFIDKMIRNGYTIEHQEKKEEEGLDGELVARTKETVLKPPMSSLPYIKLEAREVFGNYNYTDETFLEFDAPKFELLAYRRGAELHQMQDPWDRMDVQL